MRKILKFTVKIIDFYFLIHKNQLESQWVVLMVWNKLGTGSAMKIECIFFTATLPFLLSVLVKFDWFRLVSLNTGYSLEFSLASFSKNAWGPPRLNWIRISRWGLGISTCTATSVLWGCSVWHARSVVPCPGIKPAVEARNPTHWPTRDAPGINTLENIPCGSDMQVKLRIIDLWRIWP